MKNRINREVWEVSLTAKQVSDAKAAAEIAFEHSSGARRRDFGRLAERLARSIETIQSATFLSNNGSGSQ